MRATQCNLQNAQLQSHKYLEAHAWNGVHSYTETSVIKCTCTVQLPKAPCQLPNNKTAIQNYTPCIESMMQAVALSYTAIVYQTLHALM